MDSPPTPPIRSFLAQRAREGASAEQLADVVVAAWQQISTALSPVIGLRGTAALYKRSMHLAGVDHPWMSAHSLGLPEMDLAALKNALIQQRPAAIAAAGAALLLSFHGLVGSLIGPALSGQLLGAVWVNFFSGPAAQDPPS